MPKTAFRSVRLNLRLMLIEKIPNFIFSSMVCLTDQFYFTDKSVLSGWIINIARVQGHWL